MEIPVPKVAVQVVVPLHLGRPLCHYLGLFGPDEPAFLLESTLRDSRQGRFSFLAGRPLATLRARASSESGAPHKLEMSWASGSKSWSGEALSSLRDGLAALRPLPSTPPEDVPFLGGAIGYLGYELLHTREQIPAKVAPASAPPDMIWAFVDEVLSVDHEQGRAFLSVTARADNEAQAEWRAELRVFELMARVRRLEASLRHRPCASPSREAPAFESELKRERYIEKVETAQEHILAGDVFELCLTRRISSVQSDLSAEALYLVLREESPAPFAAYLRFPEAEIISASPERFLRLEPGGRVESRPIKGTRPRGSSPERDLELRNDLQTSEKDRAENLMIVDLVRHDLGRVAEFGSVRVEDLLKVETYRTVYQLVSTIQAQLRPGLDVTDLIGAAFPGGSMTGAPKIEAMKLIHQLEHSRRGIYSGALGYIDHRGGADLAMVIRSAVKSNGRFELGVGGAIVSDSEPSAEWQESEDKALGLMRAFDRAGVRMTQAVGARR